MHDLAQSVHPAAGTAGPLRFRRALVRTLTAVALASAVGLAAPAAPAVAAAPPLPSDVTAFSTPLIDPSGLFLINRGLDNSILFSRGVPADNAYSDFFSIGGQIIGDPTAAIAPQGAQVFARSVGNVPVTNLVVSYAFPTGFSTIPGLLISSEIAAVRIPPQGSLPPMIRIFARGQDDGAVYTNLLVNGDPQGWVSLGGFITSEISAAIIGPLGFPPDIRLVVRGGDNRLYAMVLNNVNGVVSGWTPLGNLIAGSNPSLSGQNALTNFQGNEVFVVDAASRAAFTWNFNSPGWVSLGGKVVGDIAVSTPSDFGLHLHVRGTTNAVYLNRRPPGSTRFGGYINLGGVLTGNISASGGGAINGRTVVDQFITRTRENGISSRIQLNTVGGFTSFFNINGPPQG
ncbi:hypothetical protein Rhe02_02150 [Rhizocola hellebori]|uniref:PLL-like beta propeller domain-containing protein n=1 Tax=Rhizocola hellebori TaxID=1392758 RepID=A0A8J3Q1M9_9ACTN|nr:hypothetical protein [Rhizocola hellebori]GIH02148.1 hypothetical protein Rhe02_02150 [Rhizocola hellebori]